MTHKVVITNGYSRDRAKALIDRAPPGYVMSIAEPKRTTAQNDLLWSILTDVSVAKPMGRRHTPEIWKSIFMDALPGEAFKARWVPSIDGEGVVNTGHRSSRLSKSNMSDLIESIYAFGAEHGVEWTHDPEERAAA